jgi:cysteine-rich repeat protein
MSHMKHGVSAMTGSGYEARWGAHRRFEMSWKTSMAVAIVAMILAAPGLRAQEVTCDNTTDFPCGFQIEALSLQKAPALFQFQSRVAQAKLPLGDATFQTVVVKLLRGAEVLCMEQLSDVEVQGSVLNLTIGQNMSCELAEVIAENANLAFQICLGGPANCLKPIELSTTPYAIKATYASLAQQAQRANVAGQASYAHRATADRDMFLRKKLGTGYFDFYTHPAQDATEVYEGTDYQPYEDGGFLQWTPVRDAEALTMHVVGKDQGTDQLRRLDELVLASKLTRATGDLLVQPDADGQGLVVTGQGLHVVGDSDIDGTLRITQAVTAEDDLEVLGDAMLMQTLTVTEQTTVSSGGIHVTGQSDIQGELLVTDGLTVNANMEVTGDCDVDGLLTATDAQINVGLTVEGTGTIATLSAGTTTVDGLLTAAQATVTGAATVDGDLDVQGQMDVAGPTVFTGHVTFEGGVTQPASAADQRYVMAEGEQRDLIFGGALALNAGATLGGDLDVGGHQMRNFRFQTSEGPPLPCEAPTEGFFYLDTLEQAVMICVGGEYKKLGGDECGDGYFEPTEQCDDGNMDPDDGCSPACQLEEGWLCTDVHVQPTTCETLCGDGFIVADETCDDGDTEPGDGCDANCAMEFGYDCQGLPSTCVVVCGDGFIVADEGCDDGDTEPGDGCDSLCQPEEGWMCTGTPSVCLEQYCGDGVIDEGETCDDGDAEPGDGCSDLCFVEPGWGCSGEPSECWQHGSQTFNPGNSHEVGQSFIIPDGVRVVTIELWGGKGHSYNNGWGGSVGGNGGYVKGDVQVEPGMTYLSAQVDKGGQETYNQSGPATWVMTSGYSPLTAILVAGGGGCSCATDAACKGGVGGYHSGGDGISSKSDGCGGRGGGQSSGGAGRCEGESGIFRYGGRGFKGNWDCAGGDGWYGGGGGGMFGGGGGGSSYYDSSVITNFEHQSGVGTGHGRAVFSW